MAGKLDLAGSQLISVETNLVDLLWTADRYFKKKKITKRITHKGLDLMKNSFYETILRFDLVTALKLVVYI